MDDIISALQFNCMDKIKVNPDSLMPEAGSLPTDVDLVAR